MQSILQLNTAHTRSSTHSNLEVIHLPARCFFFVFIEVILQTDSNLSSDAAAPYAAPLHPLFWTTTFFLIASWLHKHSKTWHLVTVFFFCRVVHATQNTCSHIDIKLPVCWQTPTRMSESSLLYILQIRTYRNTYSCSNTILGKCRGIGVQIKPACSLNLSSMCHRTCLWYWHQVAMAADLTAQHYRAGLRAAVAGSAVWT